MARSKVDLSALCLERSSEQQKGHRSERQLERPLARAKVDLSVLCLEHSLEQLSDHPKEQQLVRLSVNLLDTKLHLHPMVVETVLELDPLTVRS